jgi:hypothetical protein
MLLSAANAVFDFIGKPTLGWSKLFWKRVLHSPPYRQRQLDAWSYGLFVIMAVDAFGQNSGFLILRQDDASDEDSSPKDSGVPIFLRAFKTYELHTHAFAEQVLHHVGKKQFASQVGAHFILDEVTAARWNALARPSVKRVILKLIAVAKGLSKKPVRN